MQRLRSVRNFVFYDFSWFAKLVLKCHMVELSCWL